MRLGNEDQVDLGLAESLSGMNWRWMLMGEAYVTSREGEAPAPPVKRPSTMVEPESPLSEKTLEVCFVTAVVVTRIGVNVVGTADGQAGGVTD